MLDLFFPYIPWILGLIVLVVAYQKLSPKLKVRVPGSSISKEDVIGKILGPRYAEAKILKMVEKFKKQGNWLAAGKMLEDHEHMNEAAETYLEGNENWAAASLYEKMGRTERAAELFLQAGDHKKGAQLLVAAGKPTRAAALFQEKGNNLEAARLFGLGGAWDKAAELYVRSGYPLRAAEAYEKTGEYLRAAESYEKHFMENVSFSTSFSSTGPSADQKSALLAGQLFEKAGDQKRAFQIYSKGEFFKEAARVAQGLGQFAKAAELYLRAEDPAAAAAACDQGGDPVRAANLRGEVAFKGDRPAEAAAFFQQGKDYLRAAELFESVNMLAEAAGAYEAGDSFAAAGSVYIRAGLKDRAAASYERGGELETAAKLYEEVGNGTKATELYAKAGLTFKSGEAAAKAGERDKAIALLQRVGASDEYYRAATELLARLFIEARMPGLAIERVQKAIAGQPISSANLDLYYWLALAHETSGSGAEALSIYKKIQSEDLRFRDVEKRVARLAAGGGLTAPPSAPASRAPAPSVSRVPPPASSLPKGQRFTPKEEIGRGPLGKVFRAEDQVDGRSVALRVIRADALKGDGVLPGLVADLKAAAQLSHPNLVKVLGMVEVNGERCLVTELVQGKNFAEALKAGRKMSFAQVHGLGRVLAQTLSVIHGRKLVHGSIQPSNIMVASGVLKIADLGLGRLAHAANSPDNYRSPENRLDAGGDLYAMAAVVYHLLTGTHPKSHSQGVGLPLPSTLAPGVPEAIDKLLLRCLHPREELRFATAEEILAELKDMVKLG
jgi:tetratricopeptide (TPR) repeat protein